MIKRLDADDILVEEDKKNLFVSWKFVAPVLVTIIIALVGLVYNHMQDQITRLDELKAEKVQLNTLINHQNELIHTQAKLFEGIEETLNKAVVDIACIQTRLEVYLSMNNPNSVMSEASPIPNNSGTASRNMRRREIPEVITRPAKKFNAKDYINKYRFQLAK